MTDLARKFLSVWALRCAYHRARLVDARNLDGLGGALVVSNHGRLDFDAFMLIRLIERATGRLTRPLADRMWFKLPIFRTLAPRIGALEGSRENAREAVERGELVLVYPGGVREIMGSRFGVESTDWRGRRGFAAVALATGTPLIPVASIGVNSGHVFLTKGDWLGALLFRGVFRLGKKYEDYRDPITLSALLLPMPFSTAVHFPFPCKVTYLVGEPIWPNPGEHEDELAARVERAIGALVASHRGR